MPMTTARIRGPLFADVASRSTVAGLGAVGFFVYGFLSLGMTIAMLIAVPEEMTVQKLGMMALVIVPCFAGSFFCFRKFHQVSQQTDEPVMTVEESIPVQATILRRRAKSLQNPRYLGGSDVAAQAAVAVGAYLVLTGQWSMTIEYEVDGKRYVDHGKVSSQVYYRYANADTMPIRVRREAPTEWMPVLDSRPARVGRFAESPVASRS